MVTILPVLEHAQRPHSSHFVVDFKCFKNSNTWLLQRDTVPSSKHAYRLEKLDKVDNLPSTEESDATETSVRMQANFSIVSKKQTAYYTMFFFSSSSCFSMRIKYTRVHVDPSVYLIGCSACQHLQLRMNYLHVLNCMKKI